MAIFLTDEDKSKYTQSLTDNLSVLRAKLGTTQEELAKIIGVSRNTIACIESKKKEMSWVTFVALSMFFLQNEETAQVFKALNVYDEKLNQFFMLK